MSKTVTRCAAAVLILMCLPLGGLALDGMAYTDWFYAGEESPSGWVEVPGWGTQRYYAQNDSLWGALTYEAADSEKHRPLRDGGCGPTAAAMAIRALLEPRELREAVQKALASPVTLCICSINRQGCGYNHPRWPLTSVRDYERFLPLVLADMATGNNTGNLHGRTFARGTNLYYITTVVKAMGLEIRNTQDRDEVFRAMKEGAKVFCSSGAGGVFTNVGHYVYLAGFDDERVWFLDPLCRAEYKTNGASALINNGNGVVAIRYKDYAKARIYSYYILTKQEDGTDADN
ncbi:MAG: C39 family peptidase [Clostridia bacterium]|nr:C39 family peptidase [Clostridia bacterium]